MKLCMFGFHKTRLVWTGQIYFRKGERDYAVFRGQWKVFRCSTCDHEESVQLKEKPIKVSVDCSFI